MRDPADASATVLLVALVSYAVVQLLVGLPLSAGAGVP